MAGFQHRDSFPVLTAKHGPVEGLGRRGRAALEHAHLGPAGCAAAEGRAGGLAVQIVKRRLPGEPLFEGVGFRGEFGENPNRLREWVDSTRSRVSRGMNKELAPLPEQTPMSNVPLLLGVESYRKMTQRLVVGMLFAIPVVVFLIVYKFG